MKPIYDHNGDLLGPSQLRDFLAMIQGSSTVLATDLFKFELADGATDHFSSLDIPITYGKVVYKNDSLRIEKLKSKLAVGFQVDEQEVRIYAKSDDKLAGASFFSAVQEGLLDGATITRIRAFWKPTTGVPYLDFQQNVAGALIVSKNRVSTIDKIGRTHVEMKLKSPMVLLDIDMPRNTYQPGCQWSLFDQGCGLKRADFTKFFTVKTATDTQINTVETITPDLGGDGEPYYAQGRVTFGSGVNDNLIASIASSNSTTFFLRFPLVTAPHAGDTFTASAGCAKTESACRDKFDNIERFRAFPRVPPVVFSI